MSTKSEMSGLLKIAGEKKGLLIAASIFSVLSSLLQIAPFVAVYKIVEELLRNAQSPAGIDRELVVYWGVVAFLALVGALLALYVGLMCSHVAAFQIFCQLRVRLAEHVAKVPMGYHTKTATGELKKVIEVSVEKIENWRQCAQPVAVCLCRHAGRDRQGHSRGVARRYFPYDLLVVRTAGAGSDYGTGRTVRQRKKHRDSPDRPLLGRAAGSGGLAGELKQTIIPSKRRGYWRCQAFQARAGPFCSKTSSFFFLNRQDNQRRGENKRMNQAAHWYAVENVVDKHCAPAT